MGTTTTITGNVPHPENLPCIECGLPASHARQLMVQLGLAMLPVTIGWCPEHAPRNASPSNGVLVVENKRVGALPVRGSG